MCDRSLPSVDPANPDIDAGMGRYIARRDKW